MATYPPPTEDLPIFNKNVFAGVEYDGRYLKIEADTNEFMNGNNITGVGTLGFNDGTNQTTAFTGLAPGSIALGNVLADGEDALGQDINNLGTLNFSNGTNQTTAYDNTITITETNTNATFYPVFASGTGIQLDLRADASTTPFSINPNTSDFNVGSTLKLTQSELAIGKTSGTSQGTNCIAIGAGAGISQTTNAIAIGGGAGLSQTNAGVAIGFRAGQTQGLYGVAIGLDAGKNQSADAVAIGRNAGQGTSTAQGNNAIAIGNSAGVASQTAGSICLNASGLALNPNQVGCYINPIRSIGGIASATTLEPTFFNTTTKELVSATPTIVKNSSTATQASITTITLFSALTTAVIPVGTYIVSFYLQAQTDGVAGSVNNWSAGLSTALGSYTGGTGAYQILGSTSIPAITANISGQVSFVWANPTAQTYFYNFSVVFSGFTLSQLANSGGFVQYTRIA